MRETILETNRILLTTFMASDAALLKDLDSDPEVMKYLTDGKPSTDEDIQGITTRMLAFKERFQTRFGMFMAFEKDSQIFIGWFIFRPDKKTPDDLTNIEIGYRLRKKFWGMGYATEVSKALVDRGLKDQEIRSIFATAMKANQGSQNVMIKVGLSYVGDYTEEAFPGQNKTASRYVLKIF